MINEIKNKTKSILIIDDDELASSSFAKRLQRRGFATKLIFDSREAIPLILSEVFDLIILDLMMPNIDGLTILRKIRELYDPSQLPVIVISAIDESRDVISSFASGANDYIVKPVNIDAATARILGQLSQKELHKERILAREISAINSLVVTYQHEINNPLAVAKGQLHNLRKELQGEWTEKLDRIETSLDRIHEIMKKIKGITRQSEIEYDKYVGKTNMLKIKK